MEELNKLLNTIGISKVKLAKYLGVSRQMIYNYLQLDSLDKWPQEKRLMLFKLLDIENGEPKTIKAIKVDSEYLEELEVRLNQNVKDINSTNFNYKLLNREEQELLNDLIFLIKEKFTEDKKKYIHPTIKPLDFVKKHILHATQPNDIVLDAFCGSGTTGVACKETGRNFIGFEINKKYYDIALKRISETNKEDDN